MNNAILLLLLSATAAARRAEVEYGHAGDRGESLAGSFERSPRTNFVRAFVKVYERANPPAALTIDLRGN